MPLPGELPQLKKPARVHEIRPKGTDEKFGTRAVERIQLARPFEDAQVQEKIEFLHNLGYSLVYINNERMMKDYVGMDDPGQATEFLGDRESRSYPTLYFQAAFERDGAGAGA